MTTKDPEKLRAAKLRYRTRHRERYLESLRQTALKHSEQRKEYAAEHREMIRDNSRRWRLANAQAHRAHKAVRYAVKTGKLRKSVLCSSCGNSGRIQAHHPNGYSKEHYLDIVWLCHPCHKLAHRNS